VSVATIGLIAGGGRFPLLFAESARRAGHRVVAVAHRNETDPALAERVDALTWVKLGQIGHVLEALKAGGATQSVMLGAITKKRFFADAMLDVTGLRVLARVAIRSDDNLLRAFARFLEEEGVPITDPTPFLADRLAPEGVLGRERPSEAGGDAQLWEALVHPGQKLKPGARVRFEGAGVVLDGEILERRFFGRRTVRLWVDSGATVEAAIDAIGHVPLPPYIKRADQAADRERYQTVYANAPGSAEMPSAGRAFTPELITQLVAAGVDVAPLVLHTGVSSLEGNEQPYPERYRVPGASAAAVNAVRTRGGRVVAVGTTVVRALATVTDERGVVHPGDGWTEVVVTPDTPLRSVDGLVTGWHEPESSHLMMLEAFAPADTLRRAYDAALASGYLWHEFGDSHLILRERG